MQGQRTLPNEISHLRIRSYVLLFIGTSLTVDNLLKENSIKSKQSKKLWHLNKNKKL